MDSDDQNLKKGRHRKKHLYNAILKQMEFYFSDSNLSKDRFLSQLIQEDPLIDVSTFLRFNKINNLTSNVEDIVKAVSHSELLDLSKDKLKVGRKLPVKLKDNVDDCTLYVERLKSDATHEWVTSIFSEFGEVVYVSIPKYKQNGIIKGFAFVEFENEEGCNAALQHFESIECKISCSSEPEKLCSIATFESEPNENKKCDDEVEGKEIAVNVEKRNLEDEQEEDGATEKKAKNEKDETQLKMEKRKREDEQEEDGATEKKAKNEKDEMQLKVEKRKRKDGSDEDEEVTEKKVKLTSEDETKAKVVKRKRDDGSGEDELVKKIKMTEEDKIDEMEQVETDLDGEDKKKKKSKKLNKKKLHLKELGLLVLSKKDWKKMRNRYLNMQRNTMKQLKMHLYQQKYGNRFNKHKESEEKPKEKLAEAETDNKVEFESGIIVKVSLTEPCIDNKKLKAEIKSLSEEIKFVDIPLATGSEEIFIRFSNSESAQSFSNNSKFDKGKSCILSGEEEKLYMEKIIDSRMSKQKKSQTKQRGRDKLLKKAERQASQHIRFDAGDA